MDADRAQTAARAFACLYPFAIFYSAAYTEGLFLLAMLGAWYHLRRDERWPAFAWGLLAGLTRPNGCLLSIPLALLVLTPLVARRPAAAAGRRLGEPGRSAGRGGRPRLRACSSTRPTSTTSPAIRSCGFGSRWPGAGRTSGVAAFLAGEWDSVGEQGAVSIRLAATSPTS